MPFTSFRNPYGFEPQDYDYQNAGGLPGLLRDAMQRQALQPGSGVGAEVSSTPSTYSGNYGNPQGLLGRLLELQAKQGIPSAVDGASFASGAAAPAIPVQFRIPLTPGRLPWPPAGPMPPGPQPTQRVPMPSPPEPWPTIGKVMQLLPRLLVDPDSLLRERHVNEDSSNEEGARKTPRKPNAPRYPLPLPPFWPPESDKDPDKSQSNGGGGGGGGGGGDLGGGNGGKFDDYRKCKRAADRGTEDAWNDFCDDLNPDARQLRALCRKNTYESQQMKQNFCQANFGID